MSEPSWRGQIQRALNAIDHIGASKYQAKKAQGWKPGEAVEGLFSYGYKNTVFDRAITFTNWLSDYYPGLRLFREVDQNIVAEYLAVKTETCTPDTVRTLIATMQKLQEGLLAMNWIVDPIVPDDWRVDGRNPPRGPYAADEAMAIYEWVNNRNLRIHRRGVHGFRGTAACEFVDNKRALGYTEIEARHELAQWLGHNPHRTEVTYAYLPRLRQYDRQQYLNETSRMPFVGSDQ